MPEGSCNCGAVTYRVTGPVRGPSLCHCGQCRKQSGHARASAYVDNDRLDITRDAGLKRFSSSEKGRCGFCGTCGALLFRKRSEERTTSFSPGSLDGATGQTLEKHIFTHSKGDYYTICDDLPHTA
jgi:hypothetical protein